jgi:hypothetical protein
MTAPADAEKVMWAIRLGWYVAEVRGRSRPDGPEPPNGAMPSRADGQLPLRSERNEDELRIEAHGVLTALAGELLGDAGTQRGQDVNNKAQVLYQARHPAGGAPADETTVNTRWGDLAESIAALDTYIQDTLTATSDTQACGYQLGRGLAECYWALNIEPPPQDNQQLTGESWEFLLGQPRCDELSRLAGRLGVYFNSYTAAAVSGTLAVWQKVAKTADWRQEPDARDALYQQIRRWYGVVVLIQDPSSLVSPYTVYRNFRGILKGFQGFLPQLLVAGGSLGAVSWLIDLLNTSHGNAIGKSLLGIASALGLSGSGITARLKNTAQSLTTRLKQDVYADVVAAEMTIAPGKSGPLTKTGDARGRKRDRMVTRAVRNRTLTAVSDPPA